MRARDSAAIAVALFLGSLLLSIGWALVDRPFQGIDEVDHAYRASAVAAGQIRPSDEPVPDGLVRGTWVSVRSDIAEAAAAVCREAKYQLRFNCTPRRVDADRPDHVVIGSAAGNYNPTWYLLVGPAAELASGSAVVLTERILNGFLCSLLIGLAGWLTARRARSRWPLLGLLVALTPTTTFSFGNAAPNGMSLAAGVLLWSALLSVLAEDGGGVSARVGWGVSVLAAGVLVHTHTVSLMLLPLILASAAVFAGPGRLARVLRRDGRVVWLAAAAAAAFAALAAWWVLASGTNSIAGETAEYGRPEGARVAGWLLLWPLQAIGAFPGRQTPAPLATYALELLVLLAVIGLALRAARGWTLAGLVVTIGLAYAVPYALVLATYSQTGEIWQGRYGYPLAAGIVLLAATVLDRAQRPALPAWVAAMAVAALTAATLIGQFSTAAIAVGKAPFDGWQPAPWWLVVGLALAATAAWAWAATRPRPLPSG